MNCGLGDVCCISAGLNVRPMFGSGRILEYQRRMATLTTEKRKLAKYGHWKIRSEGLVMAVTAGERDGNCFYGRRRAAWIDDVR